MRAAGAVVTGACLVAVAVLPTVLVWLALEWGRL